MNAKDVKGILALLQTEYPASFARLDDQQMQAKANLWAELLEQYPAKLVYAAVKSIMVGDAREFAPSIGDITNRIHSLTSPLDMSETEAWALVSKACANGIYGYEEEYNKLPPSVQAAVGRPEQLREWAMMDVETVQSVVASNFMRSFKTTAKRERDLAMIPDDIKQFLNSVGSNAMLGDGS